MNCTRAHETPIESLLDAPDSPESIDFLAHCERCDACSAELTRHRNRSKDTGLRRQMLAIGCILVVGALLLFWLGFGTTSQRSDRTSAGSSPIAANPPLPQLPRAAKPAQNPAGSVHSLGTGGRVEITIDPEQPDRPVAFRLELGESPPNAEPPGVRIIATDGRILELEGALADDRMTTSIEVPTEFLSPGRYMVEVKTTELTHFPLRRYVIVVQSSSAEFE